MFQENQDKIFKECMLGDITQSFSQKLLLKGHEIGEVEGKFRLINMPFISQMKIGVMQNSRVWF